YPRMPMVGIAYAETGDVSDSGSDGTYTDPLYSNSFFNPLFEEMVTGPDGIYEFSLRQGRYSLSIYTEGYYPHYTMINIPANTSMTMDIALEEIYIPPMDAFVHGVVTNEAGEPIAMAEVSLEGAWYMMDQMSMDYRGGYNDPYWGGYYWDTTDDDGEYGVEATAGVYQLYVWADGYVMFNQMVELGSDIPLEINVTLENIPVPDSRISGVIEDKETGSPLSGAFVSFYRDETGYWGGWEDDWYGDEGDYYGEQGEPRTDGSYDEETSSMPSESPMPGEPSTSDEPAGATMVKYDPDMDGYYEEPYWGWADPGYGWFYGDTVADENGHYELPIAEGVYVLEVYADGHMPAYIEFEIGAEDHLVIDVLLEEGNWEGWDDGGWMIALSDGSIGSSPMFSDPFSVDLAWDDWSIIDLGSFFSDADGDSLDYWYDVPEGFEVVLDSANNQMRVRAPDGFEEGTMKIYASDGTSTISGEVALEGTAPTSSLSAITGGSALAYIIGTIAAAALLITMIQFRGGWRGPKHEDEMEDGADDNMDSGTEGGMNNGPEDNTASGMDDNTASEMEGGAEEAANTSGSTESSTPPSDPLPGEPDMDNMEPVQGGQAGEAGTPPVF
ncbi:MAG: hypothetical protein KAT70_07180, partial [Thermoplasmata archaeon]|nr:hypothetical protein [Thermoplasmata archaeon]